MLAEDTLLEEEQCADENGNAHTFRFHRHTVLLQIFAPLSTSVTDTYF